MRHPALFPIAVGMLFAGLATAQARPLNPGASLGGQSAEQVAAIEAETRAAHPSAEIHVSFDLGTRTYTVEARPRTPTHDGGGGDSGGDGGGE
jgi:hypothetical protein